MSTSSGERSLDLSIPSTLRHICCNLSVEVFMLLLLLLLLFVVIAVVWVFGFFFFLEKVILSRTGNAGL